MSDQRVLFRQEALEAKRGGWLGGVLLVQSIPAWVFTACALLAATAVLCFLILATYTRRSTVVGQLVPTAGLAVVVTPVAGVVQRVDVAEGASVRAGDVLAGITVPRTTLTSGDAQAALALQLEERQRGLRMGQVAQQQQLSAQAGGLASQLADAQLELSQVEAEISTRNGQAKIARETLERLRQLQAKGYVSLLDLKQQESVVLEGRGTVQQLERQATVIRGNIAQLRQSMAMVPAQRKAADASYARDLAQLAQERVEAEVRNAPLINAPVDGVVATLLAKPGQSVQAGQPLMTVLSDRGLLEAELLVPSRAIGFIAPGDKVLVRYQAYPYQKFGHHLGTVARISRSALGASELSMLARPVRQGESYYRVTVALARQSVIAYGKRELLKPGMLLEADILGEKRRLIEWVFEPLYSLKGKVGA